MKRLALEFQENGSDADEVKKCSWKMLNDTLKRRMILKLETCCHLAGLETFSCSETVEPVSILGTSKLGISNATTKTFI